LASYLRAYVIIAVAVGTKCCQATRCGSSALPSGRSLLVGSQLQAIFNALLTYYHTGARHSGSTLSAAAAAAAAARCTLDEKTDCWNKLGAVLSPTATRRHECSVNELKLLWQ
jgi:hypothetical protein